MELIVGVWEKVVQATVAFVWYKAATEELDSVKPKVAASFVESAKSRWSAHKSKQSARKVEGDVRKAFMAVPGEAASASRRKVSIIGLE